MPGPHPSTAPEPQPIDPALRTRLAELSAEGWELWERFDIEVRQKGFHPFVAADYEKVLATLVSLRQPGLRFLEWGSATGVITIMADLLGFEAYGVELDPDLVRMARDLARRYRSGARFTVGSFLPSGYEWKPRHSDFKVRYIGSGMSAYPEMGHPLDDFDLVFGFPWGGEAGLMLDLMRAYGNPDARLIIHDVDQGMLLYRGGKRVG
jgi:hypothetical protein